MFRVIEIGIPEFVAKLLTTLGAERHHGYSLNLRRPLSDTISLCSLSVANVGDGWFAATEKSDSIQAIGLSSAKFQHYP